MQIDDKNKTNLRKYRIILPVSAIILGVLLIVLFFTAKLSGILFVVAILLITVGGILLKRWWGTVGEDEDRVIITDKKVTKSANSLNIYPDKILFEMVDKPQGQPWKCENDGKSYFIHIWNEEQEELIEFKLPDQAYLDPQLLATRVLELPAHRRIFRRKQTLLQQLSPMMAALGVVIMWIIIITTT